MRVLQIGRLKPLILSFVAVSIAMLAVDRCAFIVFGADPAWLPPRFYNFQQEIGGRIASAELLKGAGKLDERKLIVALGMSPVQVGLDARTLDANDPLHRTWLVLGSEGSTFLDLEYSANVLLNSPLHPAQVLIGINGNLLHRKEQTKHSRRITQFIASHIWIYKNFYVVDPFFQIITNRAADEVRLLCGLPMWATYEPSPDLFKPYLDYPTSHETTDLLESAMIGTRQNFMPEQFDENQYESEAFTRVVNRLRNHGAEVICVMMPESSDMRSLYTEKVNRQFDQAVIAAANGKSLPAVDLRASMPDELFFDNICHLNSEGRANFSVILPAKIP